MPPLNAIVLPHDPAWAAAFTAEAARLRPAFGACLVALHHIGSTSVTGLVAKPIIDLMAEVTVLDAIDTAAVLGLAYEAMGAYGIEGRRYFRKIDAAGRRTHHLHVFQTGSPHVTRHLAFRDYLRSHPEAVAAYAALKAHLLAGGQTRWEDYLDGNAAFVAEMEAKALKWTKD
jgi:GrpB-like predicted nucleotidyltransferase (UPF0157 family)